MPRRGPAYTAVISDLHISDIEPPDPKRPAWRRYKHADVVDDGPLIRLLAHLRELSSGQPVELVLAGDIFDFDTVIAAPSPAAFPISWLERCRGMVPEEARSAWKMQRILSHHPALVAELSRFMADGNLLVFIIGNHDLELHWPAVQAELRQALAPPRPDALTVCEFFRVCGGDTLVMHGNQLDAYCVCHDPLHPFIEVKGRLRVRMPFGNIAGKLMLNGMGLFNPHVESSFIRPFPEYVRFFWRYVARQQPLLAWTWFWTAVFTLWVSVDEGLRPALRDPARLEQLVRDAARRARATPAMVRALRDVAVHPAVYSPLKVARELWLDRVGLLVLLVAVVFQLSTALHWMSGVGWGWAVVLFLALLPFYVAYSRSCRSDVGNTEANIERRIGELGRIARVSRVVMGHTHRAATRRHDGVAFLNTGHWSPAYDDVECTIKVGTNAFAWVHPGRDAREAELRVFDGEGSRCFVSAEGRPRVRGLAVGTAA
ncbi:MAG: metallophosphoesterase [Pseudomonadota bacterium]|nr:metallophosphoesterase [Pseudomonadota bacterium]